MWLFTHLLSTLPDLLFKSPEEFLNYVKEGNIKNFSVRFINIYSPFDVSESKEKRAAHEPLSRTTNQPRR